MRYTRNYIPRKDWGGALTGASTGFGMGRSIGSMFGPVGGLVGGAIGTIGGAIFGNRAENRRKREEEELRRQMTAAINEEKRKADILNRKQTKSSDATYLSTLEMNDVASLYMKKGGWIGKATRSIKRRGTEGKCTPMTKPGCTGRALALAKTFHKMARNRKNKAEGGKIDIRDTRVIDTATGMPVGNKRFHASVDKDYIEYVVSAAKKHGIDPSTALAINMAETRFSKEHMNNPFMLGNYNPYGNTVTEAMRLMVEKNKMAKRLGKSEDADIIQAWNGYGTIKNRGRMYGIDTNTTPINMNENPIYGKRVVNLRDSVIRRNPDILNIIKNTKAKGGKVNASAAYGIQLGDGDTLLTNSLGNTSGTHESGQNIPITRNGKVVAFGEPGEVLVNDKDMPNTPFVLSKRIGRNGRKGISFADEFLNLEKIKNIYNNNIIEEKQAKIINMNNRMAPKRRYAKDGVSLNALDYYNRVKNNIEIAKRVNNLYIMDPIEASILSGNSKNKNSKSKGIVENNIGDNSILVRDTGIAPLSTGNLNSSFYRGVTPGLRPSINSNISRSIKPRMNLLGRMDNFLDKNGSTLFGAAGTIGNLIMSNSALNRQREYVNDSLNASLGYTPKYAKNYLLNNNIDVNDQVSAINQGYNSSISKLDLLDPTIASALKTTANLSRVNSLNSIYGERNRMRTQINNQNVSNIQQTSNINNQITNETALMKLNARIAANEQLGNIEAARLDNTQGAISEFNTILRDKDMLRSLDLRWRDSIGTGYRSKGGKISRIPRRKRAA